MTRFWPQRPLIGHVCRVDRVLRLAVERTDGASGVGVDDFVVVGDDDASEVELGVAQGGQAVETPGSGGRAGVEAPQIAATPSIVMSRIVAHLSNTPAV